MKPVRFYVAAAVIAFAASPALAQDGTAAIVNNEKILVKDIKALHDSDPQLRNLPFEASYPKIRDFMVESALILEAAKKDNVQNSAEVKKQVAELTDIVTRRVYISQKVEKMMTDAELQAMYRDAIKKIPPMDEMRASHILVKTEAEANDIIAQLKKGANFEKLAKEKSIDTQTAQNGGDLGYFTAEFMVDDFSKPVFKIKKGQISEKPIKTEHGYHVVKVVDRRIGQPPKFEEVKDLLKAQYAQKATQQILDNLEKKAKVQKFDLNGKIDKGEPAKK